MKANKLKKNRKVDGFDPEVFLDTAGVARKVAQFRRGESIYSQGEAADSVMYVQKGGVKFSVVNGSGKEAVVAMFGPSDFFGEGCMAGQTVRMGTATAITPTTVLVMEKNELLRVLHAEHELSDHFIRYMLASRALWKARYAGTHTAESFPGDAGEHDWNHAIAREFFHEQIQKIGLHRIQRQNQGQQITADGCLARVTRQIFPDNRAAPLFGRKPDNRGTSRVNGSWVVRAVILPQVMDSQENECRCRK